MKISSYVYIFHSVYAVFYWYAAVCIIWRKTLSSFVAQKLCAWQDFKCPKRTAGDGCVQVQEFSGVCGCNHEANCGTNFDSGFPITRFFFYSDIKKHLKQFREFVILPSASISTWSFMVTCTLCVSVSVNKSVLQYTGFWCIGDRNILFLPILPIP